MWRRDVDLRCVGHVPQWMVRRACASASAREIEGLAPCQLSDQRLNPNLGYVSTRGGKPTHQPSGCLRPRATATVIDGGATWAEAQRCIAHQTILHLDTDPRGVVLLTASTKTGDGTAQTGQPQPSHRQMGLLWPTASLMRV